MPTATIYPAKVACVARGTGSSPLDPNVAYPIPVTISSLLTTAVVTVVGAPQYQVPPSYAYNGTAKVAVKSIGVGFIPKYASNTKATVTIVAKIGIDHSQKSQSLLNLLRDCDGSITIQVLRF